MNKLQAGPLSVRYDNGFLRRITYGETEVLRMIYFALRDHNWNTIGLHIENENISINENDFQITYDCFHSQGGIGVMEWKGKIVGNADGAIIFEIQGRAMENFRKNRAGFCVLHPLNITNQECKITHPEGTQTTHHFPLQITPENPFKKIRSMAWQTSGISFNLSFEGDIFETEDQRNWSDASFKTFCTPLDQAFPIELKKGDKVFQRITFKPVTILPTLRNGPSFISLAYTDTSATLPALGIGASTEVISLSSRAVSLLRVLNLSHYRIEVFPAKDNWVALFSRDCENGFALGLPLEVALHLTENFKEEMESFILLCQQNQLKIKKILLLDSNGMVTSSDVIQRVSIYKEALPKVLFGAGTNYNFNEINKNRFTPGDVDFISFSTNPQEHAFDDFTILENAEAQSHLINSAKALFGNSMPVCISPVTLRKRFNPYATNPNDFFKDDTSKADPRQKNVFAAVWTFCSICSLAKAGTSAVTYFQTLGHQGIISEQENCYPVYNILKKFAAMQGKSVTIMESSNPLQVQGIQLENHTLGLVNLTDQVMEVRIVDSLLSLDPYEVKFEPLHRTQ